MPDIVLGAPVGTGDMMGSLDVVTLGNGGSITLAFGGAIEIFQMNPLISRDASWWDWIADTVAAGAMLLLVHRIRHKKRADLPRRT